MEKNLIEIYNSLETKSDKGTHHYFLNLYNRMLEPYKNLPIRFAEIGLHHGDSLRLWDNYFTHPDAKIYGIDVNILPEVTAKEYSERVQTHVIDANLINSSDLANHTFDIIIEDASHKVEDQINFVRNFKSKINPGGMFFIEDIQGVDKIDSILKQDPDLFFINATNVKNRYDDLLVCYFNDSHVDQPYSIRS